MGRLSPEQWTQVRDRFESLCDRPPGDWDVELKDLDAVVREQVITMLRAQSSPKLADSAVEQAPELARLSDRSRSGQRVGRFELLELLGAGGMGEVYRARRVSGDYEQVVAVKLLATPLGDFIERFERERQLLAQLEHPNIARLLDGGTTEQNIPYLVMEFVDGLPIDRYCDHHGLAPEDRIALVMQIVRAITFAHSRLVLHRDIKPANVLVDCNGQARLVDFGIGTLLDDKGQAEATRSGIMTPTAAAPEQLRGERTTAATDVFQLGLLIYRLLTGRHPFERPQDVGETSLARHLLELDPLPLSRADPPGPIQRIRDLEAVLARSLSADPSGRYRTAAELSDDLEAWQAGRAVRARPLTPIRSGLRWASRNPLASGALLAAVLSLVAGTGVAGWQALEARRQLAEAQRSAAESNQVAEFLASVFQSSNSFVTQGVDPTASQLLASGVASIETDLVDLPLVQARLLVAMGVTHRSRSEFDTARRLLSRAVDLTEANGGAPHKLALALSELAWVEAYLEQYDLARQLLTRALSELGAAGADQASLRGNILQRLCIVEINRNDQDAARRRIAEALIEFRRQQPPDPQSIASTLSLQGSVAFSSGDLDAALASYESALIAKRQAYGPDHHSVALALSNIATVRLQRGEPLAAAALYREAIAINEAFFGQKNHMQIAANWRGLAKTLQGLGEFEPSVQAFSNALDIWQAALGDAHSETLRVRAELAEMLWLLGRFDEAVVAQAAAPAALLDSPNSDLACLGRALERIRTWHTDAATAATALDCTSALAPEKRWRVIALGAIINPLQRKQWSAPLTEPGVTADPLFPAATETIARLNVD